MLDRDLAVLYGLTTGNLNKAVKRNIERFPEDFMFRLNKHEAESLRFQFGSLKNNPSEKSSRFQSGSLKRGSNIKYLPHVFTQEGVAMLSSALNSERAIHVNIQIMRVFVKLRELMISHKDLAQKITELERKFHQHDKDILVIFETIKKLLEQTKKPVPPPENPKGKLGFHA